MSGLWRMLRDWWRGFTDLEFQMMREKVLRGGARPGSCVWMSPGEIKAFRSWFR